ncbi:MAG TPA: hypothetical protein VMY42_04480 [Thermoguttaceae bacterium]|nr:hypothetical protein [Thermoguttaceae bacterium]
MIEDPITRPCPKCGKQLRLTEKVRGRRVRCNACKTVLTVSAETWELTVSGGPSAATPKGPAAAAPAAPRSAAPPSLPSGAGPPPVPSAMGFPPTLPSAAAGPPPMIDRGSTLAQPYAAGTRPRIRTLPLIIGGVAIMLLAAGGLVAALMLTSGGGISKAMRYLPDGSQGIMSVNISAFLDSEVFRRLKSKVPDIAELEKSLVEQADLTFSDFSRLTMGGTTSEQGAPEFVAVLEFGKPVDFKSLLGDLPPDFAKGTYSGVTVYEVPIPMPVEIPGFGLGFCYPDDRTVLIGASETLKAVLKRGGEAKLSSRLQKYVDELDFSQVLVGAAVNSGEAADLSQFTEEMPEEALGFVKMLETVDVLTFHADVDADIRFAAKGVCKTAENAEDIKKMIDGLLVMGKQFLDEMPPDEREMVRELLESIKITQSGNEVNVQVTISEKLIDRAFDQLPQGL